MQIDPLPPQVRHHERDLRPDQPTGALERAAIDDVAAALRGGQTHYVDVPGMPAVRDALAAWLGNALGDALGAGLERERVMVVAGVQEARALALQVLAEARAPVAVPEARHPGAAAALALRRTGTVPLAVDPTTLLPDAAQVRAALDAGARLVYLESPSRLSGAGYDAAERDAILAELARADAAALVDQGLAPWADGCAGFLGGSGAAEVTVLGEAFPGAGLESLAVGYLAGPPAVIAAVTTLKQIMSICTSTPSQLAALGAAPGYAERAAERRERLAALRARFAAALEARGHPPLGAAAAPVAANVLAAPAAALPALLEHGIEASEGAAFGRPGLLRVALDDRASAALDGFLGGDA